MRNLTRAIGCFSFHWRTHMQRSLIASKQENFNKRDAKRCRLDLHKHMEGVLQVSGSGFLHFIQLFFANTQSVFGETRSWKGRLQLWYAIGSFGALKGMRKLLLEQKHRIGHLTARECVKGFCWNICPGSARSSEKGSCLTSADCIYKGQRQFLLYP